MPLQNAASRRKGWCTRLNIRADNARFLLLAVLMLVYMLAGAAVFMAIEGPREQAEKAKYFKFAQDFRARYAAVLNLSELDDYLSLHADAFTSGYLTDRRPRWDYSGSFYFVGTVVSTIGFGMTTPRTIAGKALVIWYGFLGCSGAILFFNLFLERIITFWALILRQLHQLSSRLKAARKRRRARQSGELQYETATVTAAATAQSSAASPSGPSTDKTVGEGSADSLDSWKPSVYKVQFLLLCTACGIACTASAVYQPVESWTYFDSVYFCFVAFSTIGFGDLVVSQRSDYAFSTLYRVGNFCFLMLGCCCIYSFFNVTSLVLRTMLDRMIRRLDCRCTNCLRPKAKMRTLPPPPRFRRNAITERDVEE
uniref:Potassium channel subfamily K member 13 n=1 Tax=Macrostomum lignano TaxID=282301 RepID=A0A1I8H559_9PLAT